MVDDQDLDRLGPCKQWQRIRHGPDGLAPGVPPHQDAAEPGCRAVWRKHDDRPDGGQDEGLHKARRAGRLAHIVRAGNHRQVRVSRVHTHLAAPVGQRSPLRPDPVTTDDILEQGPMVRLDSLELCSVRLNDVQD